jgi:histidinol-phosphate phosphatase family protein
MGTIHFRDIDKSWTLFLDRDGVINDEKLDGYINNWEEFRFLEGVKEAMKIFSQRFGKIFIVTNQRGLAKGVTRLEDLDTIHSNLLKEVQEAGGHIDKIYYCGDLENTSTNRKPNPGMGLQAQKDFPEIDFNKALMVGNTMSDMKFGRNCNMAATIFLPTTRPDTTVPHEDIDYVFPNLLAVAEAL